LFDFLEGGGALAGDDGEGLLAPDPGAGFDVVLGVHKAGPVRSFRFFEKLRCKEKGLAVFHRNDRTGLDWFPAGPEGSSGFIVAGGVNGAVGWGGGKWVELTEIKGEKSCEQEKEGAEGYR
jgi:hypothetical protein